MKILKEKRKIIWIINYNSETAFATNQILKKKTKVILVQVEYNFSQGQNWSTWVRNFQSNFKNTAKEHSNNHNMKLMMLCPNQTCEYTCTKTNILLTNPNIKPSSKTNIIKNTRESQQSNIKSFNTTSIIEQITCISSQHF
jgi:hypothetical protein